MQLPAHSVLSKPRDVALALFAVIANLPMAVAYYQLPADRYLRSALGLLGWGLWLLLLGRMTRDVPSARMPAQGPLQIALVVLTASALAAPWWAGLPWGEAAQAAFNLAAASLVAAVTSKCVQKGMGESLFDALCGALVVVGLLNALATYVQVFAPQYCDGDWIAPGGGFLERASGNLRQANHLGTLMVWATVAVLWLGERRPKDRGAAIGLALLLIFAQVLSESRSAALAMLALPVWGLADRSLSRATKIALVLAPIAYVIFRLGLSQWAMQHGYAFGHPERFMRAGSDLAVNSRLIIWQQTLEIIRENPWTGVGFGEFHFAWMLTPFKPRPEFYDHPHNLALYLWACLGIPLGSLIILLLLKTFVSAAAHAFQIAQYAQQSRVNGPTLKPITYERPAILMVWAVALHSMLEYPLWYSYFLLPTTMMLTLGGKSNNPTAVDLSFHVSPVTRAISNVARHVSYSLCAALVIILAAWAIYDFQAVASLYDEKYTNGITAEQISRARQSKLSGHYADYEAVLAAKNPSSVMAGFHRDPHHFLQPKLLAAWSIAYAERGELDRARYLAARLAEMPSGESVEFFAPCRKELAPTDALPFQCLPPQVNLSFRDFR
jgi:O-antigen ligase